MFQTCFGALLPEAAVVTFTCAPCKIQNTCISATMASDIKREAHVRVVSQVERSIDSRE